MYHIYADTGDSTNFTYLEYSYQTNPSGAILTHVREALSENINKLVTHAGIVHAVWSAGGEYLENIKMGGLRTYSYELTPDGDLEIEDITHSDSEERTQAELDKIGEGEPSEDESPEDESPDENSNGSLIWEPLPIADLEALREMLIERKANWVSSPNVSKRQSPKDQGKLPRPPKKLDPGS
jgi:hypothetical protein